MNFEFLKDLKGLSYIYENCSNAERLAMTMPVQSVFTSRKSAEQLAKFIYMAAHNQEMEGLTFADILSDPTVKQFIKSCDVMDAFHYIRKSGNRAVHTDDEETSGDAVSVLHDLHYVAGETACLLGLIDDYPSFEDNIDAFPEAKFVDDENIDKKAREMFISYVEELNAQLERDRYVELKDAEELIRYSVEGNVEMHEYLAFKHSPKQTELIEYLQSYLTTLLRLSILRASKNVEELEISDPVTLDAKIIIDNKTFSTVDLESFMTAIDEELPVANGFVIDVTCNGILREFFYEEPDDTSNGRDCLILKDSHWTGAGMLDTLEQYKRRNNFEYKLSVFYPDSGELKCEKICNGRDIDVISECTEEITIETFDNEWWSWSLNLCAEFDTIKYHDELLKLQDIIRTSIPKDEVCYCEDAWNDGDVYILCNGIQWNCHCLKEVQDFLDKINDVLLPIKDGIVAGCDGIWIINNQFAVATWEWTEKGFKVKGTLY